MRLNDREIIIFDGAYGALIQRMDLPRQVWGDYVGCTEYVNLTAQDTVIGLHTAFLEAGAVVVETNTFGANGIVLAEYGLADRVEEINRVAAQNARRAAESFEGRFVAGSMGPGTKLPTLGHIPVEVLYNVCATQARGLIDGGVDLFIIETCQDLLQIKTALRAVFDTMEKAGRDLEVMVSVTMESTGTMLLGSSIAAVVATLEPFPLFSLGLNCATGPEEMSSHVAYLGKHYPGRVSVMPNAGIPEVKGGETVYPLTPEVFAAKVREFVTEHGVSIVGGCCGTTPDHIRAVRDALAGEKPATRDPAFEPAFASLYEMTPVVQEIPPLLIGERMNVTGSRKFKKFLLADDFDSAVSLGRKQEQQGAHLLDLSVAYAGRDEISDMTEMMTRLRGELRAPLVIDSTLPDVIEAALAQYPGRVLINSINLEDGGANLHRVCALAKRYGAGVVALAIGKDGMAMTTADKVAVAEEIYHLAVDGHGLRPQDIFFDMLTFAIGSGDPSLKQAAVETLDAIREIRRVLPGVYTVLGVSNISFGLPKAGRKVLTSVFLHEAIKAGLDAAIVDAAKILPMSAVTGTDRELCLDLLYFREREGVSPLDAFIEHFKDRKETAAAGNDAAEVTPEQRLENQLISGDGDDLLDLLTILMERNSPLYIINEILVPTMRRIGELFGRGEMLLPFVLKSAEVMKKSVGLLEPHMAKQESDARTRIVLATVQGDVHDSGKNLVDIILSNNGFEVINIGINAPVEKIIDAAKANRADAIGLSGLLVKSAMVMKETMPRYAGAGLDIPILLGGAALTPRFVAESCVPGHSSNVVYCADAFAGLKAMQQVEEGTVSSTVYLPRKERPSVQSRAVNQEVLPAAVIPAPPFFGKRHVTEIETGALLKYLNKQALFRGRWGYRRSKMTADEYAALIREKVDPLFDRFAARVMKGEMGDAKVAYGYFKCRRDENTLIVSDNGREHRFAFPRQSFPPHFCISDFFRSDNAGDDVAGFFVVTLGNKLAEEIRALYESDSYHDYLMLHGFAVELTDALAEHWHAVMRRELGIAEDEPDNPQDFATQRYQGSRYGFGYPACPDLDAHKTVFELLEPAAIGVTLTETMEMVPELSTSAIVVHHPQAKYFSV